MIHSHCLPLGDSMHNFWQLQAPIIGELRKLRSLSAVVVCVHPDHDGRVLTMFQTSLIRSGWILSAQTIEFPDYDDFIDGQCSVIIAVHNTTDSNVVPISLKTPRRFHRHQLARLFGLISMRPPMLCPLERTIKLSDRQLLTVPAPVLTLM